MDKSYYVLLISYFVFSCETARILIVIPTPSISHQVVFHPLIKELARRGHDVVTITADPAIPDGQSFPNLTQIDVHDVCYGVLHDVMPAFRLEDELYDQLKFFYKVFYRSVEEIIKTDEVQELFNNKNDYFDLIMVESITRNALIFGHYFKAPIISMSSFGMMLEANFASGSPSHPLLHPTIFHQKLYNLTMWDKIEQLWKHIKHEYQFYYFEKIQDEGLRKLFGPNIPTLRELTNKIDMFFLNIHPIWIDNQPVPPNVIYIGGIHNKPYKELPEVKDLKTYMDSSKNGVLYMSLGTNVKPSLLGDRKISMLMEVFAELPYDILLKWDVEIIPGCPKNVKIVQWIPQSDLLRHPAVKLFITQAGLQSTDEAIEAGVPMLGIPIIADQFYNAEKYLKHKIGLKLDISTVTADELKKSIKTIIEDKNYRNNIIRLRSIMHDQSQLPLEHAVWWTEYVLRHGGAQHLRAAAANMSWMEYYEFKLVSIMLTSILAVVVIIITSVYYLIDLILYMFIEDKLKTS